MSGYIGPDSQWGIIVLYMILKFDWTWPHPCINCSIKLWGRLKSSVIGLLQGSRLLYQQGLFKDRKSSLYDYGGVGWGVKNTSIPVEH